MILNHLPYSSLHICLRSTDCACAEGAKVYSCHTQDFKAGLLTCITKVADCDAFKNKDFPSANCLQTSKQQASTPQLALAARPCWCQNTTA